MIKENFDNNGYDYVDLGLPSGTLWATMNVGANNPLNCGLYFQWGDTKGYSKDQIGKDKQFNWRNYKWYDDDKSVFTKYTTPGATLELEDDAAHVNMGGDWHMPSPEQIQELIDNTTREFELLNANVGYVTFTSKKDASKLLFIPTSGYAWDSSVQDSGDYGFVWSSVLITGDVVGGQYLDFGSGYVDLGSYGRCGGLSVRGVIDKKPDNSKEKKKDMDKKLNIAEILKNVPSGTKLWSPIIGECELVEVVEKGMYPIKCKALDNNFWRFYSDGRYANYEGAKCVLFPSEENRDWSNFKISKKHKCFEPFQKVLRLLDDFYPNSKIWITDFYGYYDEDTGRHYLNSGIAKEDDDIIPYEGNEDKLGKKEER